MTVVLLARWDWNKRGSQKAAQGYRASLTDMGTLVPGQHKAVGDTRLDTRRRGGVHDGLNLSRYEHSRTRGEARFGCNMLVGCS